MTQKPARPEKSLQRVIRGGWCRSDGEEVRERSHITPSNQMKKLLTIAAATAVLGVGVYAEPVKAQGAGIQSVVQGNNNTFIIQQHQQQQTNQHYAPLPGARKPAGANPDKAVAAVTRAVDYMSSGNAQNAERFLAGPALRNYQPSFFGKFSRVTVTDLKVTGTSGSHVNLKGTMTFVYKDGSIQKESRSFTVLTQRNGSGLLVATEFDRVLKSRS